MRLRYGTIALAALAACHAPAAVPRLAPLPVPAHGIPGIGPAQLDAGFWVAQAPEPDRVILTPDAIARQNLAMLATDSSLYDLERLPDTLQADRVRRWITRLWSPSARPLFDERGDTVATARLAALDAARNLDQIPAAQPLRFALIVDRADLRTFPTRLRVFSSRGDTHIDRWQETALFPGTPVIVVHESLDKQWWFVVSQTYAAWVEKGHLAEGPRDVVLGYAHKTPYLVVTGARVRTVFTPERPAVSEVPLEMGVRVPALVDWPADRPVNGQSPYTGHVIELPIRTASGGLEIVPALLPPTADVSSDYLPLTASGIVRQAFKFLGERYGWGHSYDGRDCSGFVSEVYRSFGVDLPRNTGDQAKSPALKRVVFTDADGPARRLDMLAGAHVGDLVYIPGHVMMVLGHWQGMPYVIHDVTGVSLLAADGSVERVTLNGVSVTPLTPLRSGPDHALTDRITTITEIRP